MANADCWGARASLNWKTMPWFRATLVPPFGGVLVNEVPTWRADQMPYGGVRDSGNTREGPAYAVREMTEQRLVIINP